MLRLVPGLVVRVKPSRRWTHRGVPYITGDIVDTRVDSASLRLPALGLLKYLHFWGHSEAHQSEVGKACLSQWYPAEFTINGLRFPTAEHYMMFRKAQLFNDGETAERILGAGGPAAVKALGRGVRGFDAAIWRQNRSSIVVEGNYAKFSQSAPLREFLVGTKHRVLVEASPVDKIWGIGLAADDPHADNPLEWRGLNLLGFALMDVRERF